LSVSGRQAVTTAGEPPPVEAEITARVPCPDDVAEKLIRIAPPERATYLDTYFDRGGLLRRADYELRVREVRSDAGRSTLLTLKGAPVDAESGSRTELETAVADAAAVRALLVGLGYEPWAAFTKQCTNHRFTRDGLAMLATLVTIPTVDGTFLEVETIVPPSTPTRLGRTLRTIRSVLRELRVRSRSRSCSTN